MRVEARKAGIERWLARGSHLRHREQPAPRERRRHPLEVNTCPGCGKDRAPRERGRWVWTETACTFWHPWCAR